MSSCTVVMTFLFNYIECYGYSQEERKDLSPKEMEFLFPNISHENQTSWKQ